MRIRQIGHQKYRLKTYVKKVNKASALVRSFGLFVCFTFQLNQSIGKEDEDLDSLNFPYTEQKCNDTNKKTATFQRNTIEQIDDIMDHSIEIESNKRMRSANVNPWTLRFKDCTMETQVTASKPFIIRIFTTFFSFSLVNYAKTCSNRT